MVRLEELNAVGDIGRTTEQAVAEAYVGGQRERIKVEGGALAAGWVHHGHAGQAFTGSAIAHVAADGEAVILLRVGGSSPQQRHAAHGSQAEKWIHNAEKSVERNAPRRANGLPKR